MAEDKTGTTGAKSSDDTPTYHRDQLLAESVAYFGQPAHVVAGALHGEHKQNFTHAEVKKAIDAWLKQPEQEG